MLLVRFSVSVIISIFINCGCAVEQGKFTGTINPDRRMLAFPKTLYKQSTIKITVDKTTCDVKDADLKLEWLVRSSSCFAEYAAVQGDAVRIKAYFEMPYLRINNGGEGYYQKNKPGGETIHCGQAAYLEDMSKFNWTAYHAVVEATKPSSIEKDSKAKRQRRDEGAIAGGENTEPKENTNANGKTSVETEDEGEKAEVTETKENADANGKTSEVETEDESKKAKDSEGTAEKDSGTETKTDEKPDSNTGEKSIAKDNNHVVTTTQYEAPYLVIVSVSTSDTNFSCKISVAMKSPKGFLSAHEYPLLTFYLVMCIVYSLYAFVWLVMSACNFRDLLRVQFWIGGVILLGMIEKAVFYSEYFSVNATGESVTGAEKFAQVVSALKRALARMLVIIVSLGFGIVKPRLGPMLHRVIGIGMLYFILAVIEALVRTDSNIRDSNNSNLFFAFIPLAVLDSIICWWIFVSLTQTMKTLRLRRNVVKLTLYRHFANTIIFCVIASFIMIFWSVKSRDDCVSEWPEMWVDDAFWHVLFSVILVVIMILWRPNINNQRYAFSPLIDGEGDEGAEEPMLGAGATETIKMRGLKNAADPVHNPATKAEDDLKWIEENIPQTVADAALPAIMDSDEEVMTTKYEMSKME